MRLSPYLTMFFYFLCETAMTLCAVPLLTEHDNGFMKINKLVTYCFFCEIRGLFITVYKFKCPCMSIIVCIFHVIIFYLKYCLLNSPYFLRTYFGRTSSVQVCTHCWWLLVDLICTRFT